MKKIKERKLREYRDAKRAKRDEVQSLPERVRELVRKLRRLSRGVRYYCDDTTTNHQRPHGRKD